MEALGKVGIALTAIGGILVGILGIMAWLAVDLVAWYQGLSYLVLGVGLLLWGAGSLFAPGAGVSAGSQPRQREGA